MYIEIIGMDLILTHELKFEKHKIYYYVEIVSTFLIPD